VESGGLPFSESRLSLGLREAAQKKDAMERLARGRGLLPGGAPAQWPVRHVDWF
jgi:hypothetical protein